MTENKNITYIFLIFLIKKQRFLFPDCSKLNSNMEIIYC